MAEQMQNIQRRIKSISSTERITNAMKLVSAAKLRKAKNAFESAQRYMGTLLTSIQRILDDTPDVPTEFLVGSREIKNKCYLLITSSNGLCGSFNGNVIRAMDETLKQSRRIEDTRLITVNKGKNTRPRRTDSGGT
ncbi:MAG: F0F1 ATP synthase subunit gamma [Emergencia sp.]